MSLLRRLSLALFGAGALLAATGVGAQTIVQVADIVDFTDPSLPAVAGAAILTRSPGGVDVSLHMTGLKKKAAYTAWWIIFNNPEACTVPCGADDIGNAVVDSHVFYATGYVTGTDGTANVRASLAEGPAPMGIDILTPLAADLDDAMAAEIHMVTARNHGAVKAGIAALQIGTFGGNCPCVDEQATAFLPPA